MKQTQEMTKPMSELINVIEVGDVAMFSTVSEQRQLHSRPMETCYINADGELYFFSTLDNHLSEELVEDNHANLSFVHDVEEQYISVSGKVKMINDNDSVAKYWENSYSRWIPGGLTNPNLVLLKITPAIAEYWGKNSTLERITRSIITGEESAEKVHKIMLN